MNVTGSSDSSQSTWEELRFSPAYTQHAYIRQYAARTWEQQPISTIGLEYFRPAYEVAGRRHNGSVAGRHRLRWALGRVLLPVWNVVLSVIALPFGNGPYNTRRKSSVSGATNCPAVRFADASKRDQHKIEPPKLWLIWSPSRFELVKVCEKPQFHLEWLWTGSGPDRPTIELLNCLLHWPDGSTVKVDSESWDASMPVELP